MILRKCKCGTTANTEEELLLFKKDVNAKYGYRNVCSSCTNKGNSKWLKENPTVNATNVKAWEKKHPGKAAAKSAKRNASKMLRTPSYADLKAIEAFYEQARVMSIETGIPYEVDHIIPLQGKTVSGFHIETNLQIITKTDNCKKGNSYS